MSPKQRQKKYLSLAQRIHRNLNDDWFLCASIPKEWYIEFALFEPTEKTFVGDGWFSESNVNSPLYTDDNIIGNELRVTALCLCAAMCG